MFKVLHEIDANKANWCDYISNRMLKNTAEDLAELLTPLFANLILSIFYA